MDLDVEIRRASADDIEELVEWRMEVLHDEFSEREDADWNKLASSNDTYYTLAMLDGSHTACFADYFGEPVGCGGICYQQEMPSPDNPSGKCAYLTNIYTRPAYRGHGVERKVVQWLVEEAKAQECGKIYIKASDGLREVYEDEGFVEIPGMMRIPVKG